MNSPKDYTILIVDDEETLRDAIIFDFKRKGFNVLSADNGTRGFEVFCNNKVDLVLSDIRMPGGDGIFMLKQIYAHATQIPVVIFMTGYSDVTEEEVLAMGAKKVISKPFERKALMKTAFEMLGMTLS